MVRNQNGKIDVKILDFEFAGKSGVYYYPSLNRNIKWGIEDTKKEYNESYYNYKKITFDNYVFMLKVLIDSLTENLNWLDKFTDLAKSLLLSIS